MERMKTKREHRIVVAVDESKESMYALSWCLKNFFSHNTNNTTLVLIYVKPPPPLYSSFDAAGYMFSGDAITAMEKYGRDLVNSVMERAEAVYRKFSGNINVERVVGRGDAKDVICGTVEKAGDSLLRSSLCCEWKRHRFKVKRCRFPLVSLAANSAASEITAEAPAPSRETQS